MAEIFDMVDEKKTFKQKINDTKEKFREKMEDKVVGARNWCLNNQETVIAIATIAVPLGFDLVKTIMKRKNYNDARDLKDKYIYDRSRGHYYELKKKPTNKQWRLIDERKDQGEKLSDILDDLHLLK